jgi:hypothetical protein
MLREIDVQQAPRHAVDAEQSVLAIQHRAVEHGCFPVREVQVAE